jgi:hypothetical protein
VWAARRGRLREGLGALREREYRLLFGATLTTSLGRAIGTGFGTSSALWLAAGAILGGNLTMLPIRAVWSIQARPAEIAPAMP